MNLSLISDLGEEYITAWNLDGIWGKTPGKFGNLISFLKTKIFTQKHYFGKKSGRLQPAICNTPVPDIDHRHLAAFVQHLENYTIIPNAYPVKVFCAGNLVGIVRNRVPGQVLNMQKNVRNDFPGNFTEIFFSALLESN